MTTDSLNAWYGAYAFLTEEARRLDAHDVDGWIELLADDIRYRMPVRSVRYCDDASEVSERTYVFDEDLFSLRARADRLRTRSAWAEDPASRTRHIIGNVAIDQHDDVQLSVRSNVALWRLRLDEPVGELLTGERHDVLRSTDDGLRLASRLVLTDQTVLPMSSLTTFL